MKVFGNSFELFFGVIFCRSEIVFRRIGDSAQSVDRPVIPSPRTPQNVWKLSSLNPLLEDPLYMFLATP